MVYAEWLLDVATEWLASKTIWCLAVDSTFVQTGAMRDDIDSEVSGTGYTAGGVEVTGVAASVVDGVLVLACDDVAFGEVELTDVAGVVFYLDTGDASTDRLIVADAFDPVAFTSPDIFTYRPDPSGLVVGIPQEEE